MEVMVNLVYTRALPDQVLLHGTGQGLRKFSVPNMGRDRDLNYLGPGNC
jgi:hypothetical protein